MQNPASPKELSIDAIDRIRELVGSANNELFHIRDRLQSAIDRVAGPAPTPERTGATPGLSQLGAETSLYQLLQIQGDVIAQLHVQLRRLQDQLP